MNYGTGFDRFGVLLILDRVLTVLRFREMAHPTVRTKENKVWYFVREFGNQGYSEDVDAVLFTRKNTTMQAFRDELLSAAHLEFEVSKSSKSHGFSYRKFIITLEGDARTHIPNYMFLASMVHADVLAPPVPLVPLTTLVAEVRAIAQSEEGATLDSVSTRYEKDNMQRQFSREILPQITALMSQVIRKANKKRNQNKMSYIKTAVRKISQTLQQAVYSEEEMGTQSMDTTIVDNIKEFMSIVNEEGNKCSANGVCADIMLLMMKIMESLHLLFLVHLQFMALQLVSIPLVMLNK